MTDIGEGETLWIYPEQWTRSGDPDGLPLRVIELIGRDGINPQTIWVRGVALDRITGLPVQEIVIQIPNDQPRAEQGPRRQTEPVQDREPNRINVARHTESARHAQSARDVQSDRHAESARDSESARDTEPPDHLQVGQRRYRRVY
jgi:hypothetical protein